MGNQDEMIGWGNLWFLDSNGDPYPTAICTEPGHDHESQDDFISNWNHSWDTPNPVCAIDSLSYLSPDELKNYLNAIQSYKKVVMMQQCFGGGFIEDLKNNNTIILTASDVTEVAKNVDQDYIHYDNFKYNAYDEKELQDQNSNDRYDHGEFDYHIITAINGYSPDYTNDLYYRVNPKLGSPHLDDIPFADADDNNDDIITMYEAFDWQETMNSRGATSKWSDLGNIGSSTSLEYPTVLSENITSSMTVRGDIAVTKSISISSGATLTVKPGATVEVMPGKSITVYGTLNAVGTLSKPIKFTSMNSTNWNGITIQSSGTGTLKYCEIEKANKGILVYNSDPYVEQCYFHDNSYGVYVLGTASPEFFWNTISDNTYGVRCNSGATPYFGEDGTPPGTDHGYNDIIDNTYGIYATGSTVFTGKDSCAQIFCGLNTFDNNSYDLYVFSNTTVWADWNWWPDGIKSYVSSSSSIIRNNDYWEDPEGGSTLAKSTGVQNEQTQPFDPDNINPDDPLDVLHLAQHYKYLGQTEKAIETFNSILERFPESSCSGDALIHLYDTSRRTGCVDIEHICNEKIGEKFELEAQKKASLNILASNYMRERKFAEAEDICERILSLYPDSDDEKYALYNMFSIRNQHADQSTEAVQYLARLEEKYPNDFITFEAKTQADEEVSWSLAKEVNDEPLNESQESMLPIEFVLYPAYPNPFNPNTTISFELPEAANVSMEIYNIQGQKVWSYSKKKTEFSAGKHSVNWKAVTTEGYTLPRSLSDLNYFHWLYYDYSLRFKLAN